MKKVFALIRELSARRAGFTLIELLVVIAIIGILAVAVLAAINPIEQINKGRDTSLNADASQLLGAVERFYTNSNPPAYPWNVDNTGTSYTGVNPDDPAASFSFDSRTSTAWGWLGNLSDTEELKDTFANRLADSTSFVIFRGSGSNVPTYVCYYPSSNSQRKNADGYCETNGATVNSAAADAGLTVTICATVDGSAPTTPGTNPICVP